MPSTLGPLWAEAILSLGKSKEYLKNSSFLWVHVQTVASKTHANDTALVQQHHQ